MSKEHYIYSPCESAGSVLPHEGKPAIADKPIEIQTRDELLYAYRVLEEKYQKVIHALEIIECMPIGLRQHSLIAQRALLKAKESNE